MNIFCILVFPANLVVIDIRVLSEEAHIKEEKRSYWVNIILYLQIVIL